MKVTAYEILGVDAACSSEEIKAAWKRLAIRWHPDKCVIKDHLAGVAWRFAEDAYSMLSDPARRAEYDAKLKRQGTVVPPAPDPLSDAIARLAGIAVSEVGKRIKKRFQP